MNKLRRAEEARWMIYHSVPLLIENDFMTDYETSSMAGSICNLAVRSPAAALVEIFENIN
jgi:hypothetical protein